MNYKYKAITESGTTVSGTIAAENEAQAMQLIAGKGYIPQQIKAGGKAEPGAQPEWVEALNRKLATVKAQDLMLFTKQFKTMIDAGIPVSRLLQILEQQTENRRLKYAAITMQEDIRHGASMHQAFSKHPSSFNDLYCSMVRAGEVSGSLNSVLDRLIYLIDHEYKIKSKIKSALTYPAIVVVVLAGAFLFLLNFVIPKFIPIFSRSGVALPWPTQVCIGLHHWLNANWHLLLGGIVVGIVGLVMYCKTPPGRLQRDRFFLRFPLIGPVLQKAAMSRFASIFAILQSSGVSVLNSVAILSKTIGNAAISKEFDNLEEQLQEGRGIAAPLKASRYFTPMVINMIAIGEESGNLDEMLQEVARHYDYEVEYSVGKMSDMIGPIMVLALSGVVGFFALSVMMPIFDLIKAVQH